MKTLLILLLSCLAANAFADNGSGTMRSARDKEIIYSQGEDEQDVKFKYGIQENGRWNIQDIRISKEELSKDEKAVQALKESRLTKEWAVIKGQ